MMVEVPPLGSTPVDGVVLRTDRLVLRRWCAADLDAMAELHADPVVMATLGPVMDRAASDAAVIRWDAAFEIDRWGLWCVERAGTCIGFTGLARPWFRDGVEIGWRIRRDAWGNGYATEATRAVLALGFEQIGLTEVLSFTAVINHRSRAVMERLGMRRVLDGDFEHPSLPEADPLRPHVLYRVGLDEYRAAS